MKEDGSLENALKKVNNFENYEMTRLPSSVDMESIVHLKQKYKDSVLFEIYQSDRILHSVLANRINVSPSGLNAIIKRLNDISEKPIYIEKSGKFTYYSLSLTGKEYVEEILISSFADDEKEKKAIRNIYQLLIAFKDKNQTVWEEKLLAIISGELVDDEGCGFIKEMSSYFVYEEAKVYAFLRLLVPDKDYYQPIMDYLKDCCKVEVKTAEMILQQWFDQNFPETYQLVDRLFEYLCGSTEYPNSNKLNLWNIEQYTETVFDWIQARILNGILQGMNKAEMIEYLSSYGLDLQMTWYLAEKYYRLYENYRDRRESK